MQKTSKGISNYQVMTTVTVGIIGYAVLNIPHTAAQSAGVDGVFAAFTAGIISAVLASIIAVLSGRFPNLTVIEYSQVILGKFLGKLYGALFTVYAISTAAFVIRGFGDAMKVLLLQKTPLEFIMIIILLLSVYCVHGGISTIARIGEVFMLPIVAVIGLIILFNLPDVSLFRFRASFSDGLKPVLVGIVNLFLGYLGYEVLLFLVPFAENKKKLLPYGVAGLVIPILVYTGLTFLMIGIIGATTTADLIYPTVHLARRIKLLGTFFERLDIFFLIFWILAVFTTVTVYYYMACLSVTRLAGLRNYKPFALLILPFCYIIAILPQNIIQISMLGKAMNYLGAFIAASSVPLLILSILRKKGGRNSG